jgi:hypothetical protein
MIEWEAPGHKTKIQVVDKREPFSFKAIVSAVRTSTPDGFKLVLDIGADDLVSAMSLMGMRGVVIDVTVVKEK